MTAYGIHDAWQDSARSLPGIPYQEKERILGNTFQILPDASNRTRAIWLPDWSLRRQSVINQSSFSGKKENRSNLRTSDMCGRGPDINYHLLFGVLVSKADLAPMV
mmetsp:Transcript_20241/g.44060  ORF Transcript_20241/g.44060 Transcript_20241/m.44060 type:complete len:106 (-) Transcript_20241:87-404(-)